MSKLGYYLRRTVVTIVLIWLVASFLFLVFRMMPGDYVTMLAGEGASTQQITELREKWGLNEPLYVQYLDFITNLATGDAGESRAASRPVFEYIGLRLLNSIILVLPAILTAFLLGSIYGTILGTTGNSMLEKYGIIPPTIIGTTPRFFVGILLLLVFSLWLDVFPPGGMVSSATRRTTDSYIGMLLTIDFLRHYALPYVTIVLTMTYYPALVMRGSVIEVLGEEFIYYQRLVGLKPRTQLKDIMKHASLPVITLLPASTATAISGLVVVEYIFNWPGIGTLLFSSVVARDIPVLQALFLIIAIWIIIGNYLVDIAYTIIDPRITYSDD